MLIRFFCKTVPLYYFFIATGIFILLFIIEIVSMSVLADFYNINWG